MTGNTEVVWTLKIFVARAWSYCLVTTFALSRIRKCQLSIKEVPLIKNVFSKIFGVRHQTSDRGGRVWDKCRHGNGWPRWMPPHPLLNAPSSPLGCAPLLAVTKTAQFYANPTTTPWYKSPALSAICKYIYSYSIILSPRLLDQRPKTFNFIVTPFKSWCGGLTINLLAYTTWFWKPIDHW